MKIASDYSYTTFTSLNNPVKPFKILTPNGNLFVEEVRLKEKSVKFSSKISKFVNDCFIDGSQDPLWKEYLKPENSNIYQGKKDRYAKYLRQAYISDDGNNTLLIAKDRKNDIRAVIFSLSYREQKALKDNKLCNIEAVAVDSSYRGLGVGKKLMEKTLESAEKNFTDAVLTSYNPNVQFYKKFGFEILPQDTKQKQFFYKQIQQERNDIPQYTQIMFKPLNLDKERFYERVRTYNLFENLFLRIKNYFSD